LIIGSAGTAKTILAAYFAQNSCLRNEKTLYFSFEESPDQLLRNMVTIGIDLERFINSNLLMIHASRPSIQGLEMHLTILNRLMVDFQPRTVIIDPISSFMTKGSNSEVRAMLVRLMDSLKRQQVNAVFTSLTQLSNNEGFDPKIDSVSSLADTWIIMKNQGIRDERVRSLLIVRSRGMGHHNVQKKFIISNKGKQF